MPSKNILRDKKTIGKIIKKISDLKINRKINIMEVCGTHTHTYFRFGLRKIMPDNINLISGPGCPVCITSEEFIDKAVFLAEDKKNIIVTFGDLLKVKGTLSSLEEERARGAKIIFIYSPLEAIEIAVKNPAKRVIFLGVGFETTAPLIAAVIKDAKIKNIKNLFLLSAHRLIPPALDVLCQDKDIKIDGFLCPGHVSTIIGEGPYKRAVNFYKKSCVICGFEPLDMVEAIYLLAKQIKENKHKLQNEYSRAVKEKGNPIARKLLKDVFKVEDAAWRGLGVIKKSGLALNKNYKEFDAAQFLKQYKPQKQKKKPVCLCGEVIKGKITPYSCPQFKCRCSPQDPLGPCMVSFEGTCRIYYEYN